MLKDHQVKNYLHSFLHLANSMEIKYAFEKRLKCYPMLSSNVSFKCVFFCYGNISKIVRLFVFFLWGRRGEDEGAEKSRYGPE